VGTLIEPGGLPVSRSPIRSPTRCGVLLGSLTLALVALTGATAQEPPPTREEQLWQAARTGDATVIRALLAQGVDPNAELRAGGRPLLFAAQHGHLEAVRTLLDAGATLGAREAVNGWTPLLWATFGNHCTLLPLLIERGADPNDSDFAKGWNALSWATAQGSEPCLEALLAAPRLASESVEQALGLARQLRRPALVARLEAARARSQPSAWPQFRGPGGSGVGEGVRLPAQWGGPDKAALLWQVEVPGLGHASPIVWGEQVFVATAVAAQPSPPPREGNPTDSLHETGAQSWRLLSYEARTGKLLWERVAHTAIPRLGRHPKNSYASSTPATDGKIVVALFGEVGLFAYSLSGELLWQRPLGPLDAGFFYDPSVSWGTASSPILFRDLVIVQVDVQKGSYLAAFRAQDGSPVWSTPRDELPSWSTPTIHEGAAGPELVTNGTHRLRGYDPLTGKELWSLATGNSYIVASTPVSNRELIFVGNGYRPLKPIYAIRSGSRGELAPPGADAQSSALAWHHSTGGPYYTTPLVYRDLLYVLGDNGVLAAYHAATGELVYRERIASGERFSASPVASEGRLLLLAESGEMLAVAAGLEATVQARGSLVLPSPCPAALSSREPRAASGARSRSP
jgi:outer membrane protein assembly factor BamB